MKKDEKMARQEAQEAVAEPFSPKKAMKLPDFTEIKLERLKDGLYNFTYKESFKTLEKQKIEASAFFLKQVLSDWRPQVRTGDNYIEFIAKNIKRADVFSFLVGEYLPHSHIGNKTIGDIFLMTLPGAVSEQVINKVIEMAEAKPGISGELRQNSDKGKE